MKQERTNTKLVTKISVVAAAVGMSLLAAAPAGAENVGTTIPLRVATLTVTKTVVGTPPANTTFVLHLRCVTSLPPVTDLSPLGGDPPVYDEDIDFGAVGGSKDFTFAARAHCSITETKDGGASSSSGPVSIDITGPSRFSAVITNTFDPIVTTTTLAKAAPAVETAPAFTG
jgi:hypothetical protein